MKKMLSLVLSILMILGLCACKEETPQKPEAKPFRVGFARVKLTPENAVGLTMGGYKDQISTGVLSDIFATCVAITDPDDNTLLLYTVDLVETKIDSVQTVRKKLAKATGIPEENITVSGTHTHSSPSEGYISRYEEKLAQAGEEALADRAPATIKAGSYDVPGMNFVRHYLKNDGTVMGDNFGNTVGGILCHISDADKAMRLIRFQREGDKKDVLMVNWQVHPKLASTADTSEGVATRNLLSSDFIGYTRDYVEAREDVLMAYYTGASGNLNPISRFSDEQSMVSQNAKEYGEAFGDHVITAMTQLKSLEPGSIGAKSAKLGDRPFKTHAYAVGSSLGFAVVPAEIFDTTGKQIRENSPFDITFVITCANGRDTYIPTENVWDYEVSNGNIPYEVSICQYPKGTAETLAKDLSDMLTQLHK